MWPCTVRDKCAFRVQFRVQEQHFSRRPSLHSFGSPLLTAMSWVSLALSQQHLRLVTNTVYVVISAFYIHIQLATRLELYGGSSQSRHRSQRQRLHQPGPGAMSAPVSGDALPHWCAPTSMDSTLYRRRFGHSRKPRTIKASRGHGHRPGPMLQVSRPSRRHAKKFIGMHGAVILLAVMFSPCKLMIYSPSSDSACPRQASALFAKFGSSQN